MPRHQTGHFSSAFAATNPVSAAPERWSLSMLGWLPLGSVNLRGLLKGTDIAANEAGAAETVVVEIMRFGDGESVGDGSVDLRAPEAIGTPQAASAGMPSQSLESDTEAGSSHDGAVDPRELRERVERPVESWIDDLKVSSCIEPLRDRGVVVHLDRVLVSETEI